MDQFLKSLSGPLSSHVDIRDAAYLFDVYPRATDTDASILSNIQFKITEAERKSSKRINAKDILSNRTIPPITAVNYPQYLVYQTDAFSETVFVFEIATLEHYFDTAPLINPFGRNEFPKNTNQRIMRRICALQLSYIALESPDGRTAEIQLLFKDIAEIKTVDEYRRMRNTLSKLIQKYKLAASFDTQARHSAIAGLTALMIPIIGVAYYYSSRVQNIGQRDVRVKEALADMKRMIQQSSAETHAQVSYGEAVKSLDGDSLYVLTQMDASQNEQLQHIDAIQKSLTGTSLGTDTITFYGFVMFIVFMYIFLVRRLQQTRIILRK